MIRPEQKEPVTWETKDEIRFLKKIGTFCTPEYSRVRTCQRKDLLRGYLSGLEERVVWDDLDKELVKDCVERLLRECATAEK